MEDLSTIIDELREELAERLKSWLKIASVKGEAAPGAPFGVEVRRMLDQALADAEAMGFQVRNFDGYAGDIRMGEIGVEPLAILAHLDVVPAGDGWKTDPFTPVQEGDRIYARGTSDDKGPALAALLAMLALKKAGTPLKREVRMILGCDEESGWEDIDYYKAHCDMPRSGFSPDASYPVINTEKGLLHLSLRAPYSKEGLAVKSIQVGERCNVIPGEATALVFGDSAFCDKANRLAVEMHLNVKAEPRPEGMVLLSSSGVPGHAAYPEIAKNALGQLTLFLRALGVTGALKTLADAVGMEYDGTSLNIRCSDETSGSLTCNLGILRYDESGLYATLDIRYPILCDHRSLTAALKAALGDQIEVTVEKQTEPHHVAPNSPLVMALLDAYHEVTDRPRECVATGGGTYAKCLDEGVAFGCSFPEDEDLAHQAGEYTSLDGLMQSMRIFARAIEKLAGK
ncbi:MAG: Sapep family Mn(2+)-dependent dipeptidase [Eubacteriales bacterium]|nr:Sapep family Mn(2+)-dependent dipeptidase [Eubacteriales bacterium]